MNDLLARLSSYNLFNYLVPGVLFAVLATEATPYHLLQKEVVIGLFVYYFLGMVVSRFGSLVIEPILKGASFVRFGKYADFVAATRNDPKTEVIFESSNTYRTLCSLFALLLLMKLYAKVEGTLPCLREWDATVAFVLLMVVFLFSYRKQNAYVNKRVEISAGRTERAAGSSPGFEPGSE